MLLQNKKNYVVTQYGLVLERKNSVRFKKFFPNLFSRLIPISTGKILKCRIYELSSLSAWSIFKFNLLTIAKNKNKNRKEKHKHIFSIWLDYGTFEKISPARGLEKKKKKK